MDLIEMLSGAGFDVVGQAGDGRRAVELLEYAKDGVRPPGDDTIPMSLTTGRMLMAILPEIQRATTSAGFAWFRTGVNRHTQALCRRDIFRGEL